MSALDTTGTLTRKYQARSIEEVSRSFLVSPRDTAHLRSLIPPERSDRPVPARQRATESSFDPAGLMPVSALFKKLHPILGTSLRDPGKDQERKRGTMLHKAVCVRLGGPPFSDEGQSRRHGRPCCGRTAFTSRSRLQRPHVRIGLHSSDSSHALFSRSAARYSATFSSLRASRCASLLTVETFRPAKNRL